MFSELSLKQFLDLLSSDSPTPGGGSASCIAGSFGLGLVLMSLGVSSKKLKEENRKVNEYMEILKEKADFLMRLSDDDTEAFNRVMFAYKLPKDTAEQKEQRRRQIEETLKAATFVPLSLLRTISDSLEAIDFAQEVLSQSVLSDFISGLCLVQSALYGGYANVLINLFSSKDEQFKLDIGGEASKVFNFVNNRLKEMKEKAMCILNPEDKR